jgi:hypothetical protein
MKLRRPARFCIGGLEISIGKQRRSEKEVRAGFTKQKRINHPKRKVKKL